MKLAQLTTYLESLAPLALQEDYDNSGLIVGQPDLEISQALISLDCTEAVVDEAIANGCQVIVSHHPIVFNGLKKFNSKTYVERVVEKAIRNNIAIYAIHTNLDNIMKGVNARICETLGLTNTRILAPKQNLLKKLVTYVPIAQAEQVRKALFHAGAGHIGEYSETSFNVEGTGTFKGSENSDPYVGEPGVRHHEEEMRIETIYPANLESKIIMALVLAHPYEEVAYDLYSLTNQHQQIGSGMIGDLEVPMDEAEFLGEVKAAMDCAVIRHTAFTGKRVKKVAVCGGSGGFLLKHAIAAGAEVFVTADYKYHEFFDAEGKIVIADIGHFESEQFTQQLLCEIIQEKFLNFAIRLTKVNTNPVKYFI
ncbi:MULTISPECIES: Nif3-like dinuclear metal center hexameric protein [unclassified Mucilaginibacter]|uniref:Nif3-like dinuclear metal center hexameric protein n=1 Tax=unclassified Mucilaginibacter TaxID=2617802 RepID=UPI002AC8F0E7|nr:MULTISPECIES: Nif3-like dinuclear metal center hexameric protein [unclassified Mucilaginibacter]MEB0249959.1 Nif3-like dinuclear metal center hexameric protein [Mucilaginibacter sp. 5B2]MEB0263300.1 Nif3-like dinuclear metal center hexameric protein [Mucilaginibacter sp. 10I4]MEB0278293.1 Nif3-like dinuclear metal center hexameric protein [Mucilaginibacter sp. 10B2]MEB0301208.1 Nif3-like dinuclear metal center hexameric protein [Mucilaginibacter sp. 5C4]WPX23939.1 Nif3-like dinuclear metal 